MTDLRIAVDVALPVEAATDTGAVIARRGRGKTYTASVIAEELHAAGQPFVVLDPLGAWYGLRSSADGKKPGLPVTIIGGEHGDVPLEPTAGKVIAEFVVANPAGYIVDLSGFESNAAQDRFCTAFLDGIYRAKGRRENNGWALTLILDEADSVAPQRPGPSQTTMLGAAEAIVRRGRQRGLGCILITQRPAVLNKNVLTQAGWLVLLGLTGPQDRAAIDDWIKGHATAEQRAQVLAEIAGLDVGDAFIWWPDADLFARTHIRPRNTFDSSATPKPGQARPEAAVRADVDLDQLKDAIAATIEKAKADDPQLLKARIRDLERDVADLQNRPLPEPVVERVEVPTVDENTVRDLMVTVAEIEAIADGMRTRAERFDELAANIATALEDGARDRQDVPRARPASDRPRARHVDEGQPPQRPDPSSRRPAGRQTVPRAATTTGHLPRGEHRVLTAIAQHTAGVTREQLTVLTGYKRSSRDTYLQRLRERGLIAITGATIDVLADGLAALGDSFEPLPTGSALREHWLATLPAGERTILACLIEVYPQSLTRDELTDLTDYKRSSRDTYLQRLKARQLVTTDGNPRAANVLFDEPSRGRP